jgi:NTP pyrophosphatase (non-canonical NTP hydrolase)
MEKERELIKAIETAITVAPGDCSCDADEDHLCNICFVADVLRRCHLYIRTRMAVADYTSITDEVSLYAGKGRGLIGLLQTVLGLVSEAGEVANELQRQMRDNQRVVDELNTINLPLDVLGIDTESILDECGDTLFHLTRTIVEAGGRDIREVMGKNIVKIRAKREKILKSRREREGKNGE